MHAEGLEGGETHGFMAAGHCCGFFVVGNKMEGWGGPQLSVVVRLGGRSVGRDIKWVVWQMKLWKGLGGSRVGGESGGYVEDDESAGLEVVVTKSFNTTRQMFLTRIRNFVYVHALELY